MLFRTLIFSLSMIAISACTFRNEKGSGADGGLNITSDTPASFESVRTLVFERHCKDCHGVGSGDTNLLDYSETMTLVVPGNPGASRLFQKLRGQGGNMPKSPSPALSPAEEALIQKWILAGAPESATGDQDQPKPLPPPNPTPQPSPTPDPGASPTPPPTAPPPEGGGGNPPPPLVFDDVMRDVIIGTGDPKTGLCLRCHGGIDPGTGQQNVEGFVDLSSYKAMQDSLMFVPDLLVPGDAEKSSLYLVVKNDSMPRGRTKLTPLQKQILFDWIQSGAREK